MKKYIWLSVGFGLLILLIILLANVGFPFSRVIGHIPQGDKVGHFVLFGILAFLVNKALSCRMVDVLGNDVLIGSLCVLGFVVIEEFSQLYFDSRTFDVTDLMYDSVGIYSGGFLAVASDNIQQLQVRVRRLKR
ncbi:MAG: VanZ family protein [Chloroflexota bacterium]